MIIFDKWILPSIHRIFAVFNILPSVFISFKNYLYLPTWAEIRMYYSHWGIVPYFLVFTLINFILSTIQIYVWWPITGVKSILDKIYAGQDYERSAHVLKVIGSCKHTSFDKIRCPLDFMTIHHSFQNPDYVLSDNVMLVDVTTKKAYFVQMPDTIHHYTAKTMPFQFITLTDIVTHLIEMPLQSFHKLANKVGHPSTRYDRITFLFNIGRSGSTVIARMIEESDPSTIVLSEPSALFEFIGYVKFYPAEFSYPALRSALYLLFKPISGKKRILIKPTHFISFTAEHIHKILPEAKMYYCYRDPIEIVWSQERAFSYSPGYKFLFLMMYSKIWPVLERYLELWRSPFLEHYINSRLKWTRFECCVIIWADCYLRYREHSEKFDFPTIYYNDLFENPSKFCLKILNLFDLPESLLDKAMSVLKEDAQSNTVLSKYSLRNLPVTICNEEMKTRCDSFCDGLNLPRLNINKQYNPVCD